MPIDFSYEFKEMKRSIPKYAKTKPEALRNLSSLKALHAHDKIADQFHALDNIMTSELLRLRAGVPQKYKELIMVSPRAVDPDAYQRYTQPHDWVFDDELSDEDYFKYGRHYYSRMAKGKGSTKTRVVRGEGSEGVMQIPVIPVVDYTITQEGKLKVFRVVILHETEFEDSYDPRTDPLDSDLKKLSDKEWELLRKNINNAILALSNAGEGIRRTAINSVMPEMMRRRDENLGAFSKVMAPLRDYFKGEDDRPYSLEGSFTGSGEFEE